MRVIVQKSVEYGLIDENREQIWECLIEVRNAVVHNNARADKDADYPIRDFIVSFRIGQELRGGLDFFVRLTDVAVDEYYYWVNQMLKL